MATRRFNSPSKLETARQWLREHMEAGTAYSAGELQGQAIQDGIKRRTLQLAATYEADIEPVYGARGITSWQWKLK